MSSYPPGGEYDERLLASIPAASRAEKQEGYNINLLDKEQNSSPVRQNPPSNLGHTNGDFGAGPSSKEVLSSRYQDVHDFAQKPVPWYRQGRWRIGMLIAAIIIIGAVVGGAVGGTVGKHKTSTVVPPPSGPSTATLPGPSTQSTSIPNAGTSTRVGETSPAASSNGGATILTPSAQSDSASIPSPRVTGAARVAPVM